MLEACLLVVLGSVKLTVGSLFLWRQINYGRALRSGDHMSPI